MTLRRKVTHAEQSTEAATRWRYTLECGHQVTRRGNSKRPHQTTYCDACQLILDRMEQSESPVHTSKDLRATKVIMKFLEQEGHVEAVRPVYSQATYWKRAKR